VGLVRSRPYKPASADIINLNGTSNETHSSNWAGAVLIGNGYTSVASKITVPAPQLPSGADSSTSYCASAWVGIDGELSCKQTGLDFCIQGNTASYSAWYERYPDYAHDFSNIQILPGNVVRVTVDATSQSSSSAVIEYLSTGASLTHQFPNGFDANLCKYNAEWIVEDFSVNSGLAPFANFGTVVFSNAVASVSGKNLGPSSATIMEIYQDQVLTSSSITDNSVTVIYI
jgi:hypothetical protein